MTGRNGRVINLALVLTAFLALLVPVYSAAAGEAYTPGVACGISCAAALCSVGTMTYIRVQRGRTQGALEEVIRTDPLTGLANGEGFNAAARRLLDENRTEGYAVVDFDINYFEKFNSAYGHEAGDGVLRHISEVLKENCGKNELCARIEADHFVCLIAGGSLGEIVGRVQRFDTKIRPLKHGVTVLLSYGVYWIEDRGDPVSVLRDRATAAKRTVKGNYEQFIGVYDRKPHQRQVEDSALVGRMEEALAKGEFVAYYQPKYDTYTEEIVGAEALVRWVRPEGEITPPDRFIRLFEEQGLITKLDWYMFERVCAQLRSLRESGTEAVPVSVNFSRAHLYDEGFAEGLEEIAQRYGVPPEQLEIEMTESMFFDNPGELYRMMHDLHEKGFRISIDDFGSGYSSLNMLKDSSFDIVKLDKAFMDQSASERGRIIIRGILKLTHELQMKTVAEGVSSAEQVAFLRESGCDMIQGYYYAKPMEAGAFISMLPQAKAGQAVTANG